MITPILAWLQQKLGFFVGWIIYWLGSRLYSAVFEKIKDWLEKRARAKRQKEAQDKLEEDVQTGRPADEGARKDEEDYLNS